MNDICCLDKAERVCNLFSPTKPELDIDILCGFFEKSPETIITGKIKADSRFERSTIMQEPFMSTVFAESLVDSPFDRDIIFVLFSMR